MYSVQGHVFKTTCWLFWWNLSLLSGITALRLVNPIFLQTFLQFNPFMHNVVNCPDKLVKYCGVCTVRFLKYVWPFLNIMHETVKCFFESRWRMRSYNGDKLRTESAWVHYRWEGAESFFCKLFSLLLAQGLYLKILNSNMLKNLPVKAELHFFGCYIFNGYRQYLKVSTHPYLLFLWFYKWTRFSFSLLLLSLWG